MIVLSVIPVTMNLRDMVFAVFDLEWEKGKARQRLISRISEPKDRVAEVVTMVREQHPFVVVVDAVAAGPMFIEQLEEKGIPVCKVYPEGSAVDEMSFTNRRSELYFRFISWVDSKKGIRLKRNEDFVEQKKMLKPIERKGGKWHIESREEFAERTKTRDNPGMMCDELDAYAFCFVKEEEWEDSPGEFGIEMGRTKEYGRGW